MIGFALVTSGVAGCSATTGASGAVQDVASAAASTASSAPAASCAEGGVCQIGDAGPGGGIVFYVASAPFTESGSACNTNCSYLESQPSDLSPAAWCTGPGAAPKFVVDAPGVSIGTGYSNTQSMIGTNMNPPADICTGGAGNESAAPWGGYSDWFLPSIDELVALLSVPTSVTGLSSESSNMYWSSTFVGVSKGQSTACALGVAEVSASEMCPFPVQPTTLDAVASVRAVRAF